jgi:hypothetical protein
MERVPVESNVSTVETWDTRVTAVRKRRRGLITTRRRTNRSSKENATIAERQATKNRIVGQSKRDKRTQQRIPALMKVRKAALWKCAMRR